MRVDLQTHGPEAPDKGKPSRAVKSPATAKPEQAAGADQASFSFDRVRLHSLESRVMAQPEVREAKVDALRQTIGNGEYAVSDRQIADAIAAEMRGGRQG